MLTAFRNNVATTDSYDLILAEKWESENRICSEIVLFVNLKYLMCYI